MEVTHDAHVTGTVYPQCRRRGLIIIHCSDSPTLLSRDDVRFVDILAFAGRLDILALAAVRREMEKVELDVVSLVIERLLLENMLLIHLVSHEFLQ